MEDTPSAGSKAGLPPVIRGIDESDASDPEFASVRAFETQQECTAWYARVHRCTNPKYPQCQQIYTHLCDWEQVEELLLPRLAAVRRKYPVGPRPGPVPESNRFAHNVEMRIGLRSRLRLPIHEATTEDSTLNTLRYMFFHMRNGIFVCIRAGRVVLFVPFVNKDYVNNWGANLRLERNQTVDEYYRAKRRRVREDPIRCVQELILLVARLVSSRLGSA